MKGINLYNYLISFVRNGKVVEQHFLKTIEEVKVFTAIAHSKGCMVEVNGVAMADKYSTTNDDVTITRSRFKKPEKIGWEKSVMCVETGEVFQSIKECQRRYVLNYRSLVNALKSGNPRNGLHFVPNGETLKPKVGKPTKRKAPSHKTTKKILCVTTGQQFDSVGAMIEHFPTIYPNTFYYNMNKNRPVKGLLFKYV